MTIKTQGGKVVTKDGKVSCACCELDCCMYPAQALVDGFYSAIDLPDAVTIDGVSFNRSGTGYGNTSNGVILEGNVWAKYRNGARSTRPCLIQGGVVDQFADTYTVSGTFGGSTIVTRESLCIWSGIDSRGGPVYLSYGTIFGSSDQLYKWEVSFNEYPDPFNPEGTGGLKEPNQNTPVGEYKSTSGIPPITSLIATVS